MTTSAFALGRHRSDSSVLAGLRAIEPLTQARAPGTAAGRSGRAAG